MYKVGGENFFVLKLRHSLISCEIVHEINTNIEDFFFHICFQAQKSIILSQRINNLLNVTIL